MFSFDRITRSVAKPSFKLAPIILFILMLAVAGCNFNADQPTSRPLPTTLPVIVVTATTVVVPGATTQPGAPAVVAPAVGPTQAVGSTLAVNSANVNSAQNGCTPKANWVAYQVQAGDTLGVLAARTNTTTADLVAGNCLANPDKIDVGQTIYLPQGPANTMAIPPTQVSGGS
jgi:LysM repeat protein